MAVSEYSLKDFYYKQCYIEAVSVWRARNRSEKRYEVVVTIIYNYC